MRGVATCIHAMPIAAPTGQCPGPSLRAWATGAVEAGGWRPGYACCIKAGVLTSTLPHGPGQHSYWEEAYDGGVGPWLVSGHQHMSDS